MLPFTEVVMLGSGHVAKSLGYAFRKRGIHISQVFSRSLGHAQLLAGELGCQATDRYQDILTSADLFVLAVSDDAIRHVAEQLPCMQGVVVHTSGASPLHFLDGTSSNTGVFYPLQTFSHARIIPMEEVPIIIEASNQSTTDQLVALANRISGKSLVLPYQERSWLHLAAVIAANFSNFMVAWGEELLREKKMDFDLLRPLLETVTTRLLKGQAFEAQTGPAIREDTETLARHMKMLEGHPAYRSLYEQISQNIINLNKKYGSFQGRY